MKDKTTQARIEQLHPAVRERFTNFINDIEEEFGVTVRMDEPLRSFAQQQALWAQGRTMPGEVVTWAPPGSSYHNYGLAADLVPLTKDGKNLDWNYNQAKWKKLADKYELTWGGTFPKGKVDPDHYEYKVGFGWRDLLHKLEMQDFIPGTEYVNI